MLSKRNLLVLLLSCVLVLLLVPVALASGTYYKVKDGDSLWTIARKNNTTVDKIVKLNNLKSDLLQPGMNLLVSAQSTAVTAPTPSRAAAPKVNYQPAVSRSGSAINGQDIVAVGVQYLGTPYHYGGSSPGGFDCSGFVSYCYRQFGYDLPRTAAGMAGVGVVVNKEDLVCGDLVLFQGTAGSYGITHVGIYVGSGQFIHSSSTSGRGVVYSSINDSYYSAHYYGARRVIDVPAAATPPTTPTTTPVDPVEMTDEETPDGA